jgi:hypothetical protein
VANGLAWPLRRGQGLPRRRRNPGALAAPAVAVVVTGFAVGVAAGGVQAPAMRQEAAGCEKHDGEKVLGHAEPPARTFRLSRQFSLRSNPSAAAADDTSRKLDYKKTMKVLRPIAFVLGFWWCLIAQGQVLWQNTTAGMSVDAVKAVHPNAVATDKPESLATGALALLRLGGIEIASEQFVANFYFLHGKLTQVTLSMAEKKSFSATLLTFESLTLALKARYGAELKRELDAGGLLKRAEAEWLNGRTNISVLAIAVGNNPALLNVNYQTRIAQDASKL